MFFNDKSNGLVDLLRKHAFLQVIRLKKGYQAKFEAIMQPTRTATGYRIEPCRLINCLQFLYHWLPKEQWRYLYGDGRKYGKKDTVMIALSNINNS